ncbi:MAG: hypothetical protein U0X76_06695 [Bacteroidia bacterium]
MKIRIKGNTVRIRLSKSEVSYFATHHAIEETTEFGNAVFRYGLHASDSHDNFSASFENNTITLLIPQKMADHWTGSNQIGFENEMEIGNGKKLYLLLEKDFKCLDETHEDQSDNYEHPFVEEHNRKKQSEKNS